MNNERKRIVAAHTGFVLLMLLVVAAWIADSYTHRAAADVEKPVKKDYLNVTLHRKVIQLVNGSSESMVTYEWSIELGKDLNVEQAIEIDKALNRTFSGAWIGSKRYGYVPVTESN